METIEQSSDNTDDDERIIDVDELDPTNVTTLEDIYDIVVGPITNCEFGDNL